MQVLKQNSCACPHKKTSRSPTTKKYPFFLGLLIAIVPKCPFCVLAYSSAMTLCNGSKLYLHQAGWTSWISIGLVAFTLLMVVLNYRGRRTWLAAVAIVAGGSMVAMAELYTGQLQLYYGGAALVFLGIWTNASLFSLLRSFSRTLQQKGLRGWGQQMLRAARNTSVM
ncbi:MAG: hypothetical protein NWR67_05570 [Saprospiraceae bacterium]|nr:hypothetical protein [Saprospiraceae bacterium]